MIKFKNYIKLIFDLILKFPKFENCEIMKIKKLNLKT